MCRSEIRHRWSGRASNMKTLLGLRCAALPSRRLRPQARRGAVNRRGQHRAASAPLGRDRDAPEAGRGLHALPRRERDQAAAVDLPDAPRRDGRSRARRPASPATAPATSTWPAARARATPAGRRPTSSSARRRPSIAPSEPLEAGRDLPHLPQGRQAHCTGTAASTRAATCLRRLPHGARASRTRC